MDLIVSLFKSMPGAISLGLIWGIMAIGVYVTYKILDIADLTVDGSICTGACVCTILVTSGVNVWLALLLSVIAGNLVTTVFLVCAARLWNVFRWSRIKKNLIKE